MSLRRRAISLLALAALAVSGCMGESLDLSYGRARSRSVNGTGALAELFRGRGHAVRVAVRLNDGLDDWADVIVRFAPYPGPPARDEAKWFLEWLSKKEGRRLIYVPRDYDARSEYWEKVVAGLPKATHPQLNARAEKLRKAPEMFDRPETRPKEVADPLDWFAVDAPKQPAAICKTLDGPWAVGIDPAKAALTRHETLKVEAETVLLEGDSAPLVIEWTRFNFAQVLVVANGSFLLNETLVNPARRPLAMRVAHWAGEEGRHLAFVEGPYVLGSPAAPPSVFAILKVPPFGWVAAQLLALGLAGCLARAPRLGRPRPRPPSGEDRPAAHPEALGALLARTGRADDARAILDVYRRWRNPSRHPRVGPSPTDAIANSPAPQPESPAHE